MLDIQSETHDNVEKVELLKEYLTSKKVGELSFFSLRNGCSLFGYAIYGTSKRNGKKCGLVYLCWHSLNEYIIDEIGFIKIDSNKKMDTSRIIGNYLNKVRYFKEVEEESGWLKIYFKKEMNNAQIRTASIRLKEKRIQKLYAENEKLKSALEVQADLQDEMKDVLKSVNIMSDREKKRGRYPW